MTGNLVYNLCYQEARQSMIDWVNGSERGDEAESRVGDGIWQQQSLAVSLLQGLNQSECTSRMLAMRLSRAQRCSLLSLCPLVLLVTANQVPSRITSNMPKNNPKTGAKPLKETTVSGSSHSDSDENVV